MPSEFPLAFSGFLGHIIRTTLGDPAMVAQSLGLKDYEAALLLALGAPCVLFFGCTMQWSQDKYQTNMMYIYYRSISLILPKLVPGSIFWIISWWPAMPAWSVLLGWRICGITTHKISQQTSLYWHALRSQKSHHGRFSLSSCSQGPDGVWNLLGKWRHLPFCPSHPHWFRV